MRRPAPTTRSPASQTPRRSPTSWPRQTGSGRSCPRRPTTWRPGSRRTKDVLARRGDHQTRLAAIREQALPYTDEAKAKDHEADRRPIETGKKRLEEIEAAKAKIEGDDAEAKKKALDEQAEAVRKEVARLETGLEERQSWTFEDPQVDWQHQVLVDLLAGLDRLDGGGSAGKGRLPRRHREAPRLRDRAPPSVRSRTTSRSGSGRSRRSRPPRSTGACVITRQLGLVPLGEDPGLPPLRVCAAGLGLDSPRGTRRGTSSRRRTPRSCWS